MGSLGITGLVVLFAVGLVAAGVGVNTIMAGQLMGLRGRIAQAIGWAGVLGGLILALRVAAALIVRLLIARGWLAA